MMSYLSSSSIWIF